MTNLPHSRSHQVFLKANSEVTELGAESDAAPVKIGLLPGNKEWVLPPPQKSLGPDTPSKAIVHYINATTG